MILNIFLFILGLILLIKGGDWFVEGAAGIARRFNVPELLIGATVVSIGTTLPEVLVSAGAAAAGQSQIAYGNSIGSIICNTALIAAISATLIPGAIDTKSIKIPVIFFFIASGFYTFTAYVNGTFSRLTGIILLAIFVVYMIITVRQAFGKMSGSPRIEPVSSSIADIAAVDASGDSALSGVGPAPSVDASAPAGESSPSMLKSIILLAVGAAMIAFGADLLVDNGVIIAAALGVPQTVIGLTFVAIGTSLPELITAISSIRKGHGALSVGNIIGANLFNLVLVSGLAVAINPFDVPVEKQLFGMNASYVLDIPVMWLVMIIFTVPSIIRKKISRTQGIILLAIYAMFCILQFMF